MRIKKSEFVTLGVISQTFLSELFDNRENNFVITGNISKISPTRASIQITKITLNNRGFFELIGANPDYLSGFATTDGVDVFLTVMVGLNDAFLRIPPDRYISSERERNRSDSVDLRHDTFKNWLFQTQLNKESEALFQEIVEQFDSAPFNHGRILMARTGDDLIDIFVEDAGKLKLPLGRKGSGLQQILMILAFVTMTRSRFLGIEELEINLSPESQIRIFNSLLSFVHSTNAPVGQIFLTTHSPLLARHTQAATRAVAIANGKTSVSKAVPEEMDTFFNRHF